MPAAAKLNSMFSASSEVSLLPVKCVWKMLKKQVKLPGSEYDQKEEVIVPEARADSTKPGTEDLGTAEKLAL